MGFCWRRIVLIALIFLIFGASMFASRSVILYDFLVNKFSSSSSDQLHLTEDMLLERLAVSLPDVIKRLSQMNPHQQKQLIEKVRKDTIAAAAESGQSDETAQKLGTKVATVLSKVISRPSIADAYF
ncbi:hypothetical protein [Bartonella raoultii]|uniref:Uncharacterized protein n=1 Tax=Bartonella raoultii TaxID=1457020 RepID=A0ABS7I7A5_9HYPH|nr:hypothetical protein [Bartonella raoultii]MBX4335061.1 hypothetical protein [Bartonella raoultii]